MLFPLMIGVAAGVAIQKYILSDGGDACLKVFDEIDYCKLRGMQMDPQELIYRLAETRKYIEMFGYSQALKEKFRKLDETGADDWQLKRYFDMAFAFDTHTELGKEAMFPVMEKRKLAHRDAGKIMRDY